MFTVEKSSLPLCVTIKKIHPKDDGNATQF